MPSGDLRTRDPKEATIVEAVRATFDEYLAWRARRDDRSS